MLLLRNRLNGFRAVFWGWGNVLGLHQISASIYNLIIINPHVSTVQKSTDLQDFKLKIGHISVTKSSSL